MKMKETFRKGSVTVYLSLMLPVLLSVLAAGLYSARMAACRAAAASGVEQGLYSLFAQYDRDLYDRFGLLLIDGGYGTSGLSLGRLLRETEEDISCVLRPAGGGDAGRDILRMQITGRSVEGYLLATDQGGASFRRQVCEISRTGLADSLLPALQSRLEGEREQAEYLRQTGEGFREGDAGLYYAEDHSGEVPYPDAEAEVPEVPEGFVNPLDHIASLRGAVLTSLVLPDRRVPSTAAVTAQELVSRRRLNRGMGMAPLSGNMAGEKIRLLSYLSEMFSCYTDEAGGPGLRYQIEYAVGGQLTDEANLSAVLQKLMTLREASNMTYLMTSGARREEASRMAALIAALMLRPDLEPAVSFALKAAWAYGESLADLRTLLAGGKIPLAKSDRSWQLPLSALAWIGSDVRGGSGSAEGLDYPEYLRLLLLEKSSDSLAEALMDLTEHVMCTEMGRPRFRLDACLEAVDLAFDVRAGKQTWHIDRKYAYDPF